jgi:NAD(P)-dependent dehydrogenase (short-subunit alcohol dehydrogenase family)
MGKLEQKVAIVTGAGQGIGKAIAEKLAAEGATVVVTDINEATAKETAEAIGGGAVGIRTDVTSRESVEAMVERVRTEFGRIDVLVNNAGIGSGRPDLTKRQTSRDGHELRFAVNYLAGFVLTLRLLALLRRSAPSRIVNVASLGQHPIDFDDVMITKDYSGSRAYAQSKLAQIMFTIDLARELAGSGVTVNSLHPATYMNTTMVREGGITPMSTVEQGGDAILRLVSGDDVAGKSGLFFNGMRQAQANPQACDAAARKRLRDLSLELTGLASA